MHRPRFANAKDDSIAGVRGTDGAISKAKMLKNVVKLGKLTETLDAAAGLKAAQVGVKAMKSSGKPKPKPLTVGAGGDADGAAGEVSEELVDEEPQQQLGILRLQVHDFEVSHALTPTEETTRVHVKTVYTLFHGRRHVSDLPVGVAHITRHLHDFDGSDKDLTSTWLFKPTDPPGTAMVPFKKPTDVLSVVDVAEVRHFLPLLRIGMRTGSLADGFLSLNGIGGDKLFPTAWWASIRELEEASGGSESGDAQHMSDLSNAAFEFAQTMVGDKMDMLTNFATAALDLQNPDGGGDGNLTAIEKLKSLGETTGVAPSPKMLGVVAMAQSLHAKGALNKGGLKEEAKATAQDKGMAMLAEKKDQLEEKKHQMMEKANDMLPPQAKDALEDMATVAIMDQMKAKLASGELSKDSMKAMLQSGQQMVAEEAKTGARTGWKQKAASFGQDQMQEKVWSKFSTPDGVESHASGQAVQSAVAHALSLAGGGAEGSEGAEEDPEQQRVAMAAPLLAAIDQEVERRTLALLAEQEQLKAALAAAEAKSAAAVNAGLRVVRTPSTSTHRNAYCEPA